MADTRYLKKRHEGWFFSLAVPSGLRDRFISQGRHGRPGKPLSRIVRSLGTQSLKEAQDKRWPLVTEWRENFKRALMNVLLTKQEIEAEAREVYTATLEQLAVEAKRQSIEDQQDGLSTALGHHRDEILDFTIDPHEQDFDQCLNEHTDFEFVRRHIAVVERRKGVEIKPGTDTYKLLGRAIVRALNAAYYGRLNLLQGKPSEAPEPFLGKDGIDPVTLRPIAPLKRPTIRIHDNGGMTVSEAASRYLDELRRDPDAKFTEQTLIRHKAIYRLFQDFTRDAPLSAINNSIASDFIDTVGKFDPDWGAHPGIKDLSLMALVEKYGKGDRHLSNATLNKYAHALSSLFKWADNRGHVEGRNPFQGQGRKKGEGTGWRPYTVDELNKLLGSELFRTTTAEDRIRPAKHSMTTAMLWIPLIALYSGMRLGEICQLRKSDVEQKGAVWVFKVTDEGAGQAVKTEAAIRIVPVHSEIIRCGFLDYVKALPAGQLWPALKPSGPDKKLGWQFSIQFTEYRRSVGLDQQRLSFHSLRKNFTTELDNADAPKSSLQALIGHKRGFTLDTYSSGLRLPALHGLIEKVRYAGLDLKHLYVS